MEKIVQKPKQSLNLFYTIITCHNGIVAWENKTKNIKPILIQSKKDNIKAKNIGLF